MYIYVFINSCITISFPYVFFLSSHMIGSPKLRHFNQLPLDSLHSQWRKNGPLESTAAHKF